MNIRSHIPNLVTILNLVSGSIAVIRALSGDPVMAAWFILLAAVFDFLDGFAARLLKAKSEIGAQLDSLADVISFGLAPSAILFGLLGLSEGLTPDSSGFPAYLPYVSLLVVVTSAYRLAKFNIDTTQQYGFRGLPTPASGIFIASLPLAVQHNPEWLWLEDVILNPVVLVAVVLILSILMVSRVPMISLKFQTYSWGPNKVKYILVITSLVLLIFFRFAGIPLIIFLYILLSIAERKRH